jgi:protein FAM32A
MDPYEQVATGGLKLKGVESKVKKYALFIDCRKKKTKVTTEQFQATMKTESEKKFEVKKKERMRLKIEEMAKKSHRERVNEYNQYLESLSEHYDIPRVGPG